MSQLALTGGPRAAEGLSAAWPRLLPEDEEAVLRALRDNYWGGIGDGGLPNTVFEREFARYHDAAHGVAVANGTQALEVALLAGGVQPGDEVLVPALTFIATASAVVSIGAIPVFVDADPETAQMSASSMDTAITPRTSAAVPVHYGGTMADLDALLEIAKKRGILMVEDCAHAQGASWRGRGAGSWGSFGCFSFQHSKSLTGGEGGIVLTSDDNLARSAALLRDIGRLPAPSPSGHFLTAANRRMGGLQGALLLSQFSRFPAEAEERDRNRRLLEKEVACIPGLKPLPDDARMTRKGCYFAILEFDAEAFGCPRQRFLEALRAEGVGWAGDGYGRPVYREPAFEPERLRPFYPRGINIPDYPSLHLTGAERWADRQVTIGHPYLLGEGNGVRLLLDALRKVRDHAGELAEA